MAFRSLVGVGGVAGATSSLRGHTMPPTPAPAPPLANFTQHHMPKTLTETKISEKAPVGRPLFSGPPEQKDGPLAQLMRGDQSMCFTCKLSCNKGISLTREKPMTVPGQAPANSGLGWQQP